MKDLLENKMFKVFIGAIILVILIIIIIAVLVSGKGGSVNAENLSYAGKMYYEKNPALLPQKNYDSATVSLSTLVSGGYISKDLNGIDCPSYVMVTNMNGKYDYTPFIRCNTNATTTLMSKLTAGITTTGSGLYNDNGKYIFKGENPNNYVKFGELLWRIIGLDENNNIKMIYSDVYVDYSEWDDRYNKDVDEDKGINEYIGNEKSRIKEYLDSFFSNEMNVENFTAARIARTTKFNTCIGKVDIESGNVNVCSETINERISTLTVEDYMKASLDKSCSFENNINCRNYNFLNLDGWTVNASSNNTHQVYFIDKDEGLKAVDAYYRAAVRPVIAIKNDISYVSGTGTMLDPYIIG